MSEERAEALALMNVSVALLHEAYDRLESLCRILQDSDHKRECSETARHIRAHLESLNDYLSVLRT
jgi:hypothetical protein